MADSVVSIQYLKDFFNSQIYDDEKWAFNVVISLTILLFVSHPFLSFFFPSKMLRAAGLFAGSIVLMRNYGDLMAI
ncbi:hypothetical protein ACSQ67_006995 [Phaseolus vulgaris]